MTIEELRMVNRICAHIQKSEKMDYQSAYSFALLVVWNKEFIRKTLNEGSTNNEHTD